MTFFKFYSFFRFFNHFSDRTVCWQGCLKTKTSCISSLFPCRWMDGVLVNAVISHCNALLLFK